ncbi:hypothetical protein A3Q56_07283 [Intoshia linei]|uniref:Uncharacterized protein n=1 Tax=Intoshia linei TaxID=1819745 RepID=A0A177AUC7_9BILA|nr:hypothetical protein A3Q56_07283 [Intoshia linei]
MFKKILLLSFILKVITYEFGYNTMMCNGTEVHFYPIPTNKDIDLLINVLKENKKEWINSLMMHLRVSDDYKNIYKKFKFEMKKDMDMKLFAAHSMDVVYIDSISILKIGQPGMCRHYFECMEYEKAAGGKEMFLILKKDLEMSLIYFLKKICHDQNSIDFAIYLMNIVPH